MIDFNNIETTVMDIEGNVGLVSYNGIVTWMTSEEYINELDEWSSKNQLSSHSVIDILAMMQTKLNENAFKSVLTKDLLEDDKYIASSEISQIHKDML